MNLWGVVIGCGLAFTGLAVYWILPARVTHPAVTRLLGAVAFFAGGYLFVSSRP